MKHKLRFDNFKVPKSAENPGMWRKRKFWHENFDFLLIFEKRNFQKENFWVGNFFDVEEARRKYQLYWRFKFSQVYISYSLSEKSEILMKLRNWSFFGQKFQRIFTERKWTSMGESTGLMESKRRLNRNVSQFEKVFGLPTNGIWFDITFSPSKSKDLSIEMVFR